MSKLEKRTTIARLIAVAAAVANEKGVSKKRLATQLEVSTKTIARDLDFLRDMLHLPLECRNQGDEWRWSAIGVEECMPLVKTLSRFMS
jgi:hypothetical protein